MGIFELAPSQVARDIEQWQPIVAWLAGPDSLPIKGHKSSF
jgi:hypothetical protein